MSSFDDLGIDPELTEALAAEGIEVPTGFQESAIPVLLRGNHLLAQAGPGAGTLVAYGVPVLQTVDPEGHSPRALVLTPTAERAQGLARSLSRLALVSGHRVAALGSPWALPEIATILFSTPTDLLDAVRSSSLTLEEAKVVVVDAFGALAAEDREGLETLFEVLPREGQRALFAQPLTPEAEAFGKARLHRAVHIPPRAAGQGHEAAPPRRGEVYYRVVGEDKEKEALETVSEALAGGTRHVVLFCSTEDQAADLGDFLALHGYLAGPPGDADTPVWLAVEELETRQILRDLDDPETVVTVSHEVPTGPDSLDRRHGGDEPGIILVRSREVAHLRDVARRTGYRLKPQPEPVPPRVAGELKRLRNRVEKILEGKDLAPHHMVLETLYRDHAPGEVAAALLALLQERGSAEGQEPPPSAEAPGFPRKSGEPPRPPASWSRLFVGVGAKDGAGPGDLLGAIAGEAGVDGSQVGKIEIRETFSLVEVAPASADRIIQAINGTTIRGRSVRVDYDRGSQRARTGRSERDSRRRGPRKGGSEKG